MAGFTVKTKKLRASFASTATDADEGDTLTYKWNFGDRSTSTLKDPAHVYPKSGTYTVKHTVSDGYTSATYEKTITVSAELSADFTVDTNRGLAITADPAVDMEDNVEYIWSFGDGSGSQEISPSHIYDEPGTYEITLTVRDGDFSEVVQTRTVTVERKLPFKLSGHVGLPGSDLVKAKVCLDVNRDFVCSANEPVTVTDANGNYVFDTYAPVADSPFACAEDNSCIQDALPLAVIAYTNQDSAKFVHGTEIPLHDNEVMSLTSFVPVSAIMSGASAGTNFDVNQFTTVTDYALKDLPQLSQLTLGVAYAWVLNLFDLTAQAVTEGTNQALITGEIASRSGILPNSLARLRDFQESAFTAQNMFSVADRDAMAADIAAVISSTDLGDDAAVANAVYTYSEDAEYSLTKLAGHNADDFKCGMSKARNVYCWGNNSWASLGDPSIFPVDEDGEYVKYGASVKNNFSADLIKVKISENEYLSNVKTFDVGNTHVCAVTFDGSVWCWGDNWYGQTGNGTVGNRTMYARKVLKGQQEIKGDYLGKIESLTLAHNVSCALTDSGEVYCWGENTALQLGASHPDLEIKAKEGIESRDGIDLTDIVKAVPTPVKVVFPDTVSGVSELTAGVSAFCALTENTSENDRHNVYCWGNDTRGLVSHNWMQYQDDWLMKYANKTLFRDRGIYTLADPNGTKPSAWKVTEDYGDYHFGDYHFLYGQPVTQIKRFTDGNSSFDLVNVTHLGISEFDYNLIVERDNDGELYYSHNNGTADHTYHRIMTTSKITFNGEKIAKLDINAEDKVSFALSDKGKLYAFNGSNIYGVWGIGSDVPYDSFSMEPKNDDGTGLWVVYPEIPNLTGVVDVSVGKRSVCAAVKRSGENSNSAGGTDTYCWGSSTFGQLGFDNRDGGFSYYDALGSYCR